MVPVVASPPDVSPPVGGVSDSDDGVADDDATEGVEPVSGVVVVSGTVVVVSAVLVEEVSFRPQDPSRVGMTTMTVQAVTRRMKPLPAVAVVRDDGNLRHSPQPSSLVRVTPLGRMPTERSQTAPQRDRVWEIGRSDSTLGGHPDPAGGHKIGASSTGTERSYPEAWSEARRHPRQRLGDR